MDKYVGQNKGSTLIKLKRQNGLSVFADNYLLSEVHEALFKSFNFSLLEADRLIQSITPFIIVSTPRSIYRVAPDSEDNFLYDICIQNSCSLLITIDKALLLDELAPYVRKTDAWLRKRK